MIIHPAPRNCQCRQEEAYEQRLHVDNYARGTLYDLADHLVREHITFGDDLRRLRDIGHNGAMVNDWAWLLILHNSLHPSPLV